MTSPLNNFEIRDALLERGFMDVTSPNRSTKSWRLKHPKMVHWISIKRADDDRPTSAAPLVVHPDDAGKIETAVPADAGLAFESLPYKGRSTQYEGDVFGRAISLLTPKAVDVFMAAVVAGRAESVPIDPLVLAASEAEIDAGLGGRDSGVVSQLSKRLQRVPMAPESSSS